MIQPCRLKVPMRKEMSLLGMPTFRRALILAIRELIGFKCILIGLMCNSQALKTLKWPYTKTHKKPCIKRCENCRQIADRKWHSINSIQCHLRSAIFGVLASFNVGFFMSFGINRNISIFCILDVCVSTIKERYQNAIIIGSEVCMKRKKTRDFLIRNIPLEIFNLLEESAKEHNRSKTQEAIVALATGLTISTNRVRQPKPFKWREKISNQFIERAIDEGHA